MSALTSTSTSGNAVPAALVRLAKDSAAPPFPARILAFLERRGVIERGPDARLAEDGFAEREPELAALATAAVTGHSPAGPEHRQRPAIALPEHGERFVSGFSAREDGSSVHAATTAPAGDARARETLCKYDPGKSPTGRRGTSCARRSHKTECAGSAAALSASC